MKAKYSSANRANATQLPKKKKPERTVLKNEAGRAGKEKANGVDPEDQITTLGFCERNDVEIAQAALDALAWEISALPGQIKVRVEEGGLTLQGRVQWPFQKQRIQSVLQHLAGVRAIDNRITVMSANWPRIKTAVAEERIPQLDPMRIRIAIAGRKLILLGSVCSWAEQERAWVAAWSMQGVTDVEDRIAVTDLAPALAERQCAAQEAFYRDCDASILEVRSPVWGLGF
jgi:osmotically-inducible protein OsmY